MNTPELISHLKHTFDREINEIYPIPVNETVVSIEAKSLRQVAVCLLEQAGITHLSAITALETDEMVTLLYHFWHGQGLTLKVRLLDGSKAIPSVVDLIPGAAFYEREIAEFHQLHFIGHANMRPLFLGDPATVLNHYEEGEKPKDGSSPDSSSEVKV